MCRVTNSRSQSSSSFPLLQIIVYPIYTTPLCNHRTCFGSRKASAFTSFLEDMFALNQKKQLDLCQLFVCKARMYSLCLQCTHHSHQAYFCNTKLSFSNRFLFWYSLDGLCLLIMNWLLILCFHICNFNPQTNYTNIRHSNCMKSVL